MGAMTEAKRRLAEHDQRLTRGRVALIEIFLDANRPLSVHELVEQSTRRLPVSSVYRHVSVLCDAHVLRRLNFDEGFIRYELEHSLTQHHHHLVCGNCQSVVDLDEDTLVAVESALAAAEAEIAAAHAFEVREHQLDLRGLCADCA